MSFKQLLGLENTNLTDLEIMDKFSEAQRNKKGLLSLQDNDGKTITLVIKQCPYFECGIMDGLA